MEPGKDNAAGTAVQVRRIKSLVAADLIYLRNRGFNVKKQIVNITGTVCLAFGNLTGRNFCIIGRRFPFPFSSPSAVVVTNEAKPTNAALRILCLIPFIFSAFCRRLMALFLLLFLFNLNRTALLSQYFVQ